MSQDQTQKRARRPEGLSKGFRPVTFSTANGIVTMPFTEEAKAALDAANDRLSSSRMTRSAMAERYVLPKYVAFMRQLTKELNEL